MRNISNLIGSAGFILGALFSSSTIAAPTCTSAAVSVSNGWGWENDTSCQVRNTGNNNSTGTGACIDTGVIGDGWGWNGESSCVVGTGNSSNNTNGSGSSASGTCVDTGVIGDGWGWNGVSSCAVGENTTTGNSGGSNSNDGSCVDTGVIGDGWGWNGESSCAVGGNNSSQSSNNSGSSAGTCVDTGTVGDGWGWNGISSCRVNALQNDSSGPDQPAVASCVDTGIVGDGWGWNGTEACEVPIEYEQAGRCVDSNLDGIYTNGVSTCEPSLQTYNRITTLAKSSSRPILDGTYDSGWNDSFYLSIGNTLQNDTGVRPENGSVRVKHDGNNLYMLIQYRDPTVYTDSPSTTRLYDDDGWELYFNLGNERHTEYDANDYHLMSDWGVTSSYSTRQLRGLNSEANVYVSPRCASNASWRTCEMSIRLSSLGADGPVTQDIGFDIHINGDVDGGERDFKLGYCGPAGVDRAWTDPSAINCALRIRHY